MHRSTRIRGAAVIGTMILLSVVGVIILFRVCLVQNEFERCSDIAKNSLYRLVYYEGDRPLGEGTGFFVHAKNFRGIVTAGHCLTFDELSRPIEKIESRHLVIWDPAHISSLQKLSPPISLVPLNIKDKSVKITHAWKFRHGDVGWVPFNFEVWELSQPPRAWTVSQHIPKIRLGDELLLVGNAAAVDWQEPYITYGKLVQIGGQGPPDPRWPWGSHIWLVNARVIPGMSGGPALWHGKPVGVIVGQIGGLAVIEPLYR